MIPLIFKIETIVHVWLSWQEVLLPSEGSKFYVFNLDHKICIQSPLAAILKGELNVKISLC